MQHCRLKDSIIMHIVAIEFTHAALKCLQGQMGLLSPWFSRDWVEVWNPAFVWLNAVCYILSSLFSWKLPVMFGCFFFFCML